MVKALIYGVVIGAVVTLGVIAFKGAAPTDVPRDFAYFERAARMSPLFAFPGMDLEMYDLALGELEKSRIDLADYWSIDRAERPDLYNAIYPLEYLKAVGELERMRRVFLDEPTRESASAYQAKLLETIDVYEAELDNYLAVLTRAVGTELYESQTRFHTGYSNAEYLERVLKVYKEAAGAARSEASRRARCGTGLFEAPCPGVSYPEIETVGDTLPSTDVVGSENLTLIRAYRDAVYVSTTSVPSVAVIDESQCWLGDGAAQYHLWWYEHESGTRIFRPDIINELYFYDFESGQQAEWNFAKEFISRGGPRYIYQPVANHYVCPDLASDMTKLLGMYFVYEESNLDTNDFFYEGQVTKYVNELRENLVANTITGKDETKAEELILSYAYKTPGYPEALMSVVLSNTVPREYGLYGTDTKFSEFLYLRSVPKLLFGGFNPSIVPVDVSLIETPAYAYPESLVPLSLLRESHSESELVDMLIRAAETEHEMVRAVEYEYLKVKDGR